MVTTGHQVDQCSPSYPVMQIGQLTGYQHHLMAALKTLGLCLATIQKGAFSAQLLGKGVGWDREKEVRNIADGGERKEKANCLGICSVLSFLWNVQNEISI